MRDKVNVSDDSFKNKERVTILGVINGRLLGGVWTQLRS